MMCQGRLVAPLIVLIAFSTLTTACGQASGNARWASFPVAIYADSTAINTTDKQSDLQDAMAFWEEKAGKKLFDYKGEYSGAQPYTGSLTNPGTVVANVIFFQNPWPLQQNIIGQTLVSTSNNEIQNAMVMINGEASFCSGDCVGQSDNNSQRKNFTHELGHFLGLQHSQDIKDVMYPVIQPGGALSDVTFDITTLTKLTQ